MLPDLGSFSFHCTHFDAPPLEWEKLKADIDCIKLKYRFTSYSKSPALSSHGGVKNVRTEKYEYESSIPKKKDLTVLIQ